ncbi:lysine racemase [Thermotoga sp. KOL6]|uniref:lysine racemase n=1 Tax=Thermotoga sp. KOL6 TaxID=126741 RepID=UPI000C792E64|nr:lysine racemase [Thermotoga sp. KOL6]PLV60298.1 alanine racemase [Thermotoga sp. KOL6]
MYPRVLINLKEIEKNARKVVEMAGAKGIEVVGVTKVTLGDPRFAETLRKAGIKILGESRIKNVLRMKKAGIDGPFMLLRLPMMSELVEDVKHFDYIMVSDPQVAKKVDEIAKEMKRDVKLIYMIDVGDLREGVWFERAVEEIAQCKGLNIAGVGTNFGCYGGIIPTREKFEVLLDVKEKLEKEYGFNIEIVSGGNTPTLYALERNEIPEGINQLRIGEAIVLGRDITNDRVIEWLSQDTFIIEAEVIEVKEKPSVPVGKRGLDVFGRRVEFVDKGIRKRAICALGEQDIDSRGLIPMNEGIEVLHASSDHIVLDVTEIGDVKIGDVFRFRMTYSCLLKAMTSPFVEKIYEPSP